MKPAIDDPVIAEIRDIRRKISARFNHDPERLVKYYINMQKRFKSRLITDPKYHGRKKKTAV